MNIHHLFLQLLLVCHLYSQSLKIDDRQGEWAQSLNGAWQFTTNFDPSPEQWHPIKVPGNWDSTEHHQDFQGIGWYRRQFTPDASLKGKKIRLHFGAVYHEAEVFLNGKRLGKHIGGYTPFDFDVTAHLHFDQANTLTVRADNTYQRGAWWPWGGISRPVQLIGNRPIRIIWQHIHAEPDLKSGTAIVSVKYQIENKNTEDTNIHLTSRLRGDSENRITLTAKAKAGQTTLLQAEFSLPKEQVRLWHFDTPELYHLETQVHIEDQVQHSLTDRFGIRKIEVTPTSFLLNGEPVRLVGFNRVSDDAGEHGNTEPDELVNLDVDLMKRCGANMSRIMHYPQAPNLLDRLDEKGMLVICEIPVWQHDSQIITNNPITKQWLTEMIHRDYNHPCIIGWSVGNEMRDFYPYATSMMEFVREELDPHRLVSYVTDLAFRKGKDEPIDKTDIALINYYNDWAKHTAVMTERWPSKPIFATEFGLKQLQPDGNFAKGFVEAWHQLTDDNPHLVGAALWTFNDYRSNFKGTPETGFRSWGVVDQHRKLKPAYHVLRKLFSPLQQFTIEGNKVTVQPRKPNQTPSYALRGYKLGWKTQKNSGEVPLPELLPGDDSHSVTLPINTTEQQLEVTLISPLGYDLDLIKR